MKKLVILAALAAAAVSASALEVGVRAGNSPVADNTVVGATIGQKFGPVGLEAAFDRTTRGSENLNKWSAVASYDMVTLAGVTIAPKAGVAFIDPSIAPNGYAVVVGAGASLPVTSNIKLVADAMWQDGQTRVSGVDGVYYTVGVKYSF
jgi:hypothetical protein